MPAEIVCTDMVGRSFTLKLPVNRIISLVPSQTEFLYAIGLEDKIAGQTVFCVNPPDAYKKSFKVGGTKKVKYDKIAECRPDLIICNKEENTEEIVEKLARDYPVWVSDIKNTDDAFVMMSELGKLLGAEKKSTELIEKIKSSLKSSRKIHIYDAVYLIWRKPYMAAGADTFVSHMMKRAGFINMIHAKRYPELSEEDLITLNPPLVLLSSEPYPFNEKHAGELKKLLPGSKIICVDGEMFSWYGSHLLNSQNYFNELQRQLHKAKK